MPLDRAELLEHLGEQLGFLQDSCDLYDQGRIREHKRIALILRILLHDTRNSHSLFEQLGIKNRIVYKNTASPFYVNTGTIFRSNFGNLVMVAGPEGISYEPKGSDLDPSPDTETGQNNPNIDFDSWWTENLMEGDQGALLTRKFCVLNVTNTDGGAHIDTELPADYLQLSRKDQYGWQMMWLGEGEGTGKYSSPIPPILRQVAYEIFKTVKINSHIIY